MTSSVLWLVGLLLWCATTPTEETASPLPIGAIVKLVLASFLTKAIGATIALFVLIGFVLGLVVARLVYHRRG